MPRLVLLIAVILALVSSPGLAQAPRTASVPATHPHDAWTTTEEVLIQVHGVGPTDITFMNPADDPRKK